MVGCPRFRGLHNGQEAQSSVAVSPTARSILTMLYSHVGSFEEGPLEVVFNSCGPGAAILPAVTPLERPTEPLRLTHARIRRVYLRHCHADVAEAARQLMGQGCARPRVVRMHGGRSPPGPDLAVKSHTSHSGSGWIQWLDVSTAL